MPMPTAAIWDAAGQFAPLTLTAALPSASPGRNRQRGAPILRQGLQLMMQE